mmetsp:Transcript_56165/g.177988  ORF Transcript_56165/g.177988 Transcript_56165/m.177988 type:complete len:216 (+) Transcript_56165:1679-2326(+)
MAGRVAAASARTVAAAMAAPPRLVPRAKRTRAASSLGGIAATTSPATSHRRPSSSLIPATSAERSMLPTRSSTWLCRSSPQSMSSRIWKPAAESSGSASSSHPGGFIASVTTEAAHWRGSRHSPILATAELALTTESTSRAGSACRYSPARLCGKEVRRSTLSSTESSPRIEISPSIDVCAATAARVSSFMCSRILRALSASEAPTTRAMATAPE